MEETIARYSDRIIIEIGEDFQDVTYKMKEGSRITEWSIAALMITQGLIEAQILSGVPSDEFEVREVVISEVTGGIINEWDRRHDAFEMTEGEWNERMYGDYTSPSEQ